MFIDLPNKAVRGLFVAILGMGLCLAGLSEAATGYSRSSGGRNYQDDSSRRGTSSPDPQKAEKIRVTSENVSNNLTKMLTIVNEGRIPDTQTIEAADTTVREGRLVLNDLQPGMQSKYFMLQAWTSFFQGDVKMASLAAARAYRTNLQDHDARATSIAMSVLSGKKPQTQAPPKPRTSASDSEYSYSGSGSSLLSLDIDAIKSDLFGRSIGQMQLNCLNGTGFSYNSADEGLCLLVWQLPETIDANSVRPAVKAKAEPVEIARQRSTASSSSDDYDSDYDSDDDYYGSDGDNDYSSDDDYNTDSSGQNGDTFQSQMDAFAGLFADQFDNAGIRFLAINVDKPGNKGLVMKKLLSNSWPWAQVMAKDPTSGAKMFADIEGIEPTLLVVSRGGAVTYAGPATGFLASLAAKQLSAAGPGGLMALAARQSTTAAVAPASSAPAVSSPVSRISPPPAIARVASRPAPTPTPAPAPQEPITAENDPDIMDPDHFQAARLLEGAKQFIKMGRYTTYKRGIDMCRDILRDYGDTPYADQARKQLQLVPERYRTIYKVTNEEMGL